MPQVAPVIGKILATKIIATLTVKAVVVAAIKIAATYAISRALTRGSKNKASGLSTGDGSELTMSREAAPARRIIYGQTRVSGPMAYWHVAGNANENLECVVLLASHECDGIASYLVDDKTVTLDGTGAATTAPYVGKLTLTAHLGDQTTADSGLIYSSGGAWTNLHILYGITYLACRLKNDAEVYAGGLPNFSAVVRGRRIYDPRTGTTAWSRNPAIILRDYLTDDSFGLGATADEIDDASFIAAANVCDETIALATSWTEPRYRCDGSFTTDAEPAQVIEQILATMAGRLVYAGGKFRCSAGAYYSPAVTLSEGDMRGAIQYQTAAGIREVCNIAKGTYTSPGDLYQPRDFPQFKDVAHVTADGEEIATDLDLAWVSSVTQAQRLAKIAERESRLGGVITLPCNLSAMRVQAGDTVAVTNTRFGWAPKIFLVQEFRLAIDQGGALGVDLVCRETSPSVYGWTAGTDEQSTTPGQSAANPVFDTISPILGSLDNDAATVPSAADGTSPVIGAAVTTMSVYRGINDDSANWTFAAVPSSGVTGMLSGRTWTTTGFTTTSGYVDITASRSGYPNVVCRFVLAKARAGAAGSNGANGLNSATVMLYKRSASAPTKPTTISTYTFATAALTGHDGGWTQTIPANDGNPLYAIVATASSTGATDTIASAEWSTPVVMAQNGTNGTNGLNTASIYLYRRSASSPALPSTASTFTFATGVLTGHNNGWTQAVPTNDGNKLWVTTATASASGATDTIANTEWAAASIMADNGANGVDGPAVFTLVNDANCTVGPNWIQRTIGSGAWNAAAHSQESYVNGAFCSMRFNGAVDAVCGLTTDPVANNSYDSIDYAWHGSFVPEARIFENGVLKSSHGAYTADTVFAVTYDGKQVQWLKDGVVCRTVAAPPNLRLYFDSSISTINSKIMGIAFGPVGSAGADATAYWLLTSASTLKLLGSTFTPTTVTFTGKSQTGTGATGNYSGRFIIAESTDGANFTDKYTSSADEASNTYTPSATTVRAIRCRFYAAGGTTTQLDEETVPVVVEPIQPFTGGSGSGGGDIGTSWTCPFGMSITLTVPAGARSIQFTGQLVNTGTVQQTLSYGVRVRSTVTAIGSVCSATTGQAFPVSFTTVVNCEAGSTGFEIVAMASVSSAILTGQFIIL
jgi:hypothetical protein